MKKIAQTLIILTFLLIIVSSKASAFGAPGAIVGPFSGDITDLFNRVTFLIRPLVLVSFLGVMLWGGYTRMTAAGDPDAESRSVKILVAGIIGFAIIALSPVIVSVATQILGIPSFI